MESMSYTFEGRGLPLTDDIELHMDGLVRSRNLLNSIPIRDVFEGMGFIEPGFPEITRKSVLSTQCLENSVDDAHGDSGKSVPATSTITLNSSTEFGTRFSSSAIKTNGEKLAQTGLKIEKLAALRESKGNPISVENLSSQEPSVSAKRARIANLQSQIPVCLVHGCNKDLSSSKEYHKRHKVCDIHSKTAVVIVNGIHQRFCQQCSRFHVLAEFDEGKRSCRKRLAGHNERRRKPQLDAHFDSTFFGTDLSRTSLLFSKILPSGYFGQQRHVKLEEDPSQISQSAVPLKFGCSLPKSLLHLHEMGKQYPSKNCLNSPLSVLELSAGSNSSFALSLLSAQSQNSLSNSAGISMDHPLISKEYHHANLALIQNSPKPSGKSTPKYFTPSDFSSSSGEVDHRVPDASVSVGFGTPQNELPQESNALNLKHHLSTEGANTVDLLQLSLHLQRVEQQKHTSQVRLENGIFCHPTTI
ncbi:hypothetical protein Pfo_023881 [Paulownia fortunei]|nr:hypothetical protein Pfo_023881 [Paulownia fortunei]